MYQSSRLELSALFVRIKKAVSPTRRHRPLCLTLKRPRRSSLATRHMFAASNWASQSVQSGDTQAPQRPHQFTRLVCAASRAATRETMQRISCHRPTTTPAMDQHPRKVSRCQRVFGRISWKNRVHCNLCRWYYPNCPSDCASNYPFGSILKRTPWIGILANAESSESPPPRSQRSAW